MTFLLDVNVLIALLDPAHVRHEAAHRWFAEIGSADWATCPITENGVLRILGQPRYPNSPGPPAAVFPLLVRLRRHPGWRFWPDGYSLVEAAGLDASQLRASDQITDAYLLGLALSNGGALATFDRRLSTAPFANRREALYVIDGT